MDTLAVIDWNDILSGPSPVLIVMLSLMAFVLVVGIIATQWRRTRIAEADAGLKLRMVDQGFSADDIERVLQTKLEGKQRHGRRQAARGSANCTSDFVMGKPCS